MNRRLIFFLFISIFKYSSAQDIYNFGSYYNIQFNPSYAGQDTNHTFILGGFFSAELLKPENTRMKGTPYSFQFAYSGNIKKFKSGIGFIGKMEGIGVDRIYDLEILYDFNYTISKESNVRAGIAFTNYIHQRHYQNLKYWDPGDPNNLFNTETVKYSNADIGVWYVFRKLNLGLSVKNIFNDGLHAQQIQLVITDEFVISSIVKSMPSLFYSFYEGTRSKFSGTNYRFSNYFSFFDVLLIGAGIEVGHLEPFDGGLCTGIGANANNHLQVLLGYTFGLPRLNYDFNYLSAMVKMNLY